ncbi:MAG: CoA ester lyase [Rhodospirillaceae bacterium]|nr:CoA ester lyase [Rhodospirillaceae bacterium]|tara:strand:+ start:2658 stop:3503 length:846 start_codon:yes stop_codon:yes gene_type:complete
MSEFIHLNRSFLFVPGDRPERFDKAKNSGCDAIIIDLEDAVSTNKKDLAREIVIDYFSKLNKGEVRSFVRVNSIKTYFGLKDVTAFIDNGCLPDGIVLPMVDSAEEVILLDEIIKKYKPDISIFVVIETPKGLSNVISIASATSNVEIIGFGSADFTSQTGSSLSWNSLLYARSKIINAAGIAGITAVDGVWPDINDEEGLLNETKKIVDIGFKGKIAIHPKQIPGIHQAFSPNQEDVNFAKEVIDAYEAAKGGVISVRGKMIDEPLVISARRVLSLSERE